MVRLAEGCYTANATGVDRVEFQLVRDTGGFAPQNLNASKSL